MKQIIIMIATIVLGLAIGAIIMGFQDTAEAIGDSGTKQIETVFKGAGMEL